MICPIYIYIYIYTYTHICSSLRSAVGAPRIPRTSPMRSDGILAVRLVSSTAKIYTIQYTGCVY